MTITYAEGNASSVSAAPSPEKRKKVRTSNATRARARRYEKHVRTIVKAVREAREFGIWKADNMANWLNCYGVRAPNGGEWTKGSTLRALHRLRQLGRDEGPAPARREYYSDLATLAKQSLLAKAKHSSNS